MESVDSVFIITDTEDECSVLSPTGVNKNKGGGEAPSNDDDDDGDDNDDGLVMFVPDMILNKC